MELEAIISAAIAKAFRDTGRQGGLLGGPARAAALSRERRVEIARKASQAAVEARKAKAETR